jgi:hypothetical protein
MDTITHYLSNKISHFRGFNRYAKFLLIGNRIDGFLNFDTKVFNSYAEVKEFLPEIIYKIEAGGEWALELYQVPDNYKIRREFGYYKVPTRGKKVFRLGYMNFGSLVRCFIGNAVIHFESQSIHEETENFITSPAITTFSVFEENYTIHLHEIKDKLEFNLADYPGNLKELKKEQLSQRKNYSSALDYAVNSGLFKR